MIFFFLHEEFFLQILILKKEFRDGAGLNGLEPESYVDSALDPDPKVVPALDPITEHPFAHIFYLLFAFWLITASTVDMLMTSEKVGPTDQKRFGSPTTLNKTQTQ